MEDLVQPFKKLIYDLFTCKDTNNTNMKLIKYHETKDKIVLKQYTEINGEKKLKVFPEDK